MARIATPKERRLTARRKYQDARSNQRQKASHHDDARMDQILGNLLSRPWEQVVQKIVSLSDIRRDKVLRIRGQIMNGTYLVEEHLDNAIDRLLEDMLV